MRNFCLKIKFSFLKINSIINLLSPHSFIPHSLRLVEISEIKLFALEWENYSVRIIFSETLFFNLHVDISEINISVA